VPTAQVFPDALVNAACCTARVGGRAVSQVVVVSDRSRAGWTRSGRPWSAPGQSCRAHFSE